MSKQDRLLSLDIFRGITMVAMVIVNDPGSWSAIYAPLEHAHWNGCTPTDLVFPFFLFMVGTALSLSLNKARFEKEHHGKRMLHILKRSAILFFIGLVLNAMPSFQLDVLRIPGVLQRIAIVFLVCAVLFLKTTYKTQVLLSTIILLGYWIVMKLVPFPTGATGTLEPGVNLAAFVDAKLLSGHMWASTKTWDPEGVLSTFPSLVTGILGMFAGQWIKSESSPERKVNVLFVAGNLLIVAGLFWGLAFPINKSLWTSSYVLYTAGIAYNMLALLYWVIDINKIQPSILKFFHAFGINAIFAYILSNVLAITFGATIQAAVFDGLTSITGDPYLSSFIYALLFTAVMYIPLLIMYKKKIIIKV